MGEFLGSNAVHYSLSPLAEQMSRKSLPLPPSGRSTAFISRLLTATQPRLNRLFSAHLFGKGLRENRFELHLNQGTLHVALLVGVVWMSRKPKTASTATARKVPSGVEPLETGSVRAC